MKLLTNKESVLGTVRGGNGSSPPLALKRGLVSGGLGGGGGRLGGGGGPTGHELVLESLPRRICLWRNGSCLGGGDFQGDSKGKLEAKEG